MGLTAVEIRHNGVGNQQSLGLDRALRDALATYCRLRWPQHAAKHAAREWDLTLDEAKGVVAGRTSIATLDRIFKHKRGGWSVVLPVLGAVVGETIHDHFRNQIREAANDQRVAEEHERLASQAYERLRGHDVLPLRPGGRTPSEDRKTRRSA